MDKFALQAGAYRFFWNSIDWLFPPECIGCGKEGVLICSECWHSMVRANVDSCIYCGAQLPKRVFARDVNIYNMLFMNFVTWLPIKA